MSSAGHLKSSFFIQQVFKICLSDWLGLNDDSSQRRLNKNKNEFEPVSAYAMIT